MPTAALWICAAPALCPLSPFLPNSHLTFILRPPKTCELPPFTMGWRVCLRAILGHLTCVLHALSWGTLMKGSCGPVRTELSICWGCFCLRPPLRARACLGAARRLFSHLGWGYEPEVREEGARQNGATEPEVTALHETRSLYLRTGCPPSLISAWTLLTSMRRKRLCQHILKKRLFSLALHNLNSRRICWNSRCPFLFLLLGERDLTLLLWHGLVHFWRKYKMLLEQ